MKNILVIACILFLVSLSTFGQQIGETDFAVGISKTTSIVQSVNWDGFPQTYFKFNATRSWYSDKDPISFRKELGLNLQYATIKQGGGSGLGGSSYTSGNIVSLFAEAALMAQFRMNKTLFFCAGPETEFLIIGSNNLKDEWNMHNYSNNTTLSGTNYENGINRDYFKQPTYGIKACLFDSGIIKRANLGLTVSFLWPKGERSNFYATQYTRISLFIGFKNKKKEVIPDSKHSTSPSIN